MSEYRILPIAREHLSDVAELERLCFSNPWSEDALGLLLSDAALGLVVMQNGRAVAYVGMMQVLDEGQVTNVAVHPDHRRRGLGARLLEGLDKEARARALAEIVLEVRVSNAAAIALYERSGYLTAGTRRGFYTNPREDALVMVKSFK